jgi:hypothetical protein
VTAYRTFHLTDLVTVWSGVMLSERGMDAVYEIVNFVTGVPQVTHDLVGRTSLHVARWLERKHTWLRDLKVPIVDDEPREVRVPIVLSWIAQQVDRYGEWHQVDRMAPGDVLTVEEPEEPEEPEAPTMTLNMTPNAQDAFESSTCTCNVDTVTAPILINGETRSICQRCYRPRSREEVDRPETADEHTERMRARFTDDQGHLEPLVTDRGFQHLLPVSSTYGGHVRVHESSAASGPHVWVTSVAPSDLNDPTSPAVRVALHLTLEDAATLSDQLAYLVKNHYQVRSEDEDEPTG